jgi:hypoxanthine phosphoribosyltransferase
MAINKRLERTAPPHHIDDIVITEEAIRHRVRGLVGEMLDDCRVEDLVIIGILRGSFMFLADLVRELYGHGVHPRIDFMTLSSYGAGTESSGKIVVRKDITVDVKDVDVIVVDDILDTGRTLEFALAQGRALN